MEELIFRRQFLLTLNEIVQIPSIWRHLNIGCGDQQWNLYAHPDLEVTVSETDSYRLILIGYLLDPLHPNDNNQTILDKLTEQSGIKNIIEQTHVLNGRFLLLYVSNDEFKIINDVSAYRELYYLLENSNLHCGSTADIIKEYVGAEDGDDEELISFFNSEEYIEEDYTWIGYDTIYKNLKKLPPNHWLDVSKQSVERFWPEIFFEKQKPKDISKECAQLLKGTIQSATNRYPVHLGVTAGLDTRILLAASRTSKDKIFYYVNRSPDMNDDHPDIRIPKKLAAKFGFKLNIIDIDDEHIDPDFIEIFRKNNFRAHDKLLPVFYHCYKNGYEKTVTVSGTLAEGTARMYFFSPVKESKITGANASYAVGFGRNKYAISILDDWLEEAKILCKDLGINVLDFYMVEQDSPNWSSLTASEQDIVRDEIRPFNSRRLVYLFWSLPDKYRFIYYPRSYQSIIRILWKELLDIPVNPSRKTPLLKFLSIIRMDRFVYRLKLTLAYARYRK